ncbi:MAG: hypothetical protein AAGD43_25355 [Pseudomonadota bacterium]
MNVELDQKTRCLIEAAVARGDYPDEATAVADAVAMVLETDFGQSAEDIKVGRAEIGAGNGVAFENVRRELKSRIGRLSRT